MKLAKIPMTLIKDVSEIITRVSMIIIIVMVLSELLVAAAISTLRALSTLGLI